LERLKPPKIMKAVKAYKVRGLAHCESVGGLRVEVDEEEGAVEFFDFVGGVGVARAFARGLGQDVHLRWWRRPFHHVAKRKRRAINTIDL
jgi:hypothetical protein